MAITNYYTIDGRMIGESTGGTRTGYLPDALGSVTATVSESGGVVNTYRYKPYGAQLAKTGGGTDPKFLWVGEQGYRSGNGNLLYVRMRHFDSKTGTWNTKDELWPSTPAYSYVDGNPVLHTDPLGLISSSTVALLLVGPPGKIDCSESWRWYILDYCMQCEKYRPPGCLVRCKAMREIQSRRCDETSEPDSPKAEWTPCHSMARSWHTRFNENMAVNPYWAIDCVECCNLVLEHVATTTIGRSLLNECACGCTDDAEFLNVSVLDTIDERTLADILEEYLNHRLGV